MTAGLAEELELDGCTVHVRRWAPNEPRADAAPVLLVHGLGANTVSWVTVGRALAERQGAPVVAVDLVGFGFTRAVDRAATLTRNADLVVAALEEFGPSVVAGNSMGGAIAVKVAARRPDLVTGMVLVNPAVRHGIPQSADAHRRRHGSDALSDARGTARHGPGQLGPEGLVDGTLQVVLEQYDDLDPAIRDHFIAIARARMEFPEAARAYADAAASLFWYMTRNLDRDLAVALRDVPGLLLFGDRDRLIHVSSAHALSARHPTLDVEMLEGVGHAPQLDAPDRFVDAVTTWLDTRFGCSSSP